MRVGYDPPYPAMIAPQLAAMAGAGVVRLTEQTRCVKDVKG